MSKDLTIVKVIAVAELSNGTFHQLAFRPEELELLLSFVTSLRSPVPIFPDSLPLEIKKGISHEDN